MCLNVFHLDSGFVKLAPAILLAVTGSYPGNVNAAAGRYESTGALGDLTPAGGNIVFNTGGALPTIKIGTGTPIFGRVLDDIAVYDFDRIVLPATVIVDISGTRPLVIAAAKDFITAAAFDISAGRAGGGAGGAQMNLGANGGESPNGPGTVYGLPGGSGGPGGFAYCYSCLGTDGQGGAYGKSGVSGLIGNNGLAGLPGSGGFGFNYSIAGGSAGSGGSKGNGGYGGSGGYYGAAANCIDDGTGKPGTDGGNGEGGSPGGNGQPGGAGTAGYFYFPADTLDLAAGCGGSAGGGGGGGGAGGTGGSGGAGGSGGGGRGALWPSNSDGGNGARSGDGGYAGLGGNGGNAGIGGYGGSGGGAIVLSARGLLKLEASSVVNVSASMPGINTSGAPESAGESGNSGGSGWFPAFHYNQGGYGGAGGRGGNGGAGGAGGAGGPGGTGTAGMVKLQGSVVLPGGIINGSNYTDAITAGVAAKITFISNLESAFLSSQTISYIDTVVTGTITNNEVLTTTSAYSSAITVALMPTLVSGPAGAGFCMEDYFQKDKVVAKLLTQAPDGNLELIRLGGAFDGTDQVFLVNRSATTLANRFLNINGHTLEIPPVDPGKVWVVGVRSTDDADLVNESRIQNFPAYN